MIIGLFTEMLSPGGVQRASRHVAVVTAKFASDCNLQYRFLSLNDPQGLHTVRVGAGEFLVSGYDGDKSQFILAALRGACRKPLLVIALHPHMAPVVWAMRICSWKFRSIVFAHGIEVWQPLGWPRGTALRRANLVVGPSEDTVKHLIAEQKIRPERTLRLAWGLDPEFEARVGANGHTSLPLNFPPDGKIVLTVGRWDSSEQYKGADTLIAALPRVLQKVPEAYLILIGDGNDRPRLEQLARDQGVFQRTRFLHGLTQDELIACYAACDVFALPSRGEGFGLVFLEAMAYGKPVIGATQGGIPDVIEHGMTGLLVPYGDAALLADALESMLVDTARARELGRCGRERVEQTFSFDHFQSRLKRVLEDVLCRPS